MIQFPETVVAEWRAVAAASEAKNLLRQRIALDTRIAGRVEDLRVKHEAQLIFQQELDALDTPALEMGTLADYLNSPLTGPVDLIEGVMKENGLCVVLGASESGKSTVGLQMIHSLLTGDDWLGQPTTQLTGGAGILSYDMDSSMLMDWMAGMPNIDPSRVLTVNAHGRGHPLGVPLLRAQIVAQMKARNVEVVMLDSFSASFFGHDQNDAAATMAHYRDMKLFAFTEVGAKALIVIAHSSDTNPLKARGSTVHKDTADTMVGVVRNDKDERTVSVEKYRAARGQSKMSPVVVTAPDAVTHLVDLDLGAMSMAGLKLPPSAIGSVFTDMPELTAEPDTESDEDEEQTL